MYDLVKDIKGVSSLIPFFNKLFRNNNIFDIFNLLFIANQIK